MSLAPAGSWRALRAPLLCALLLRLGILALAGEQYGYMSDELYFLDAGRHLDFGYVDFPPLIAWLAALLEALQLDSILALRATAGLLGVGVTAAGLLLCQVLGGGRLACWLVALLLSLAPGFLAVQSIFTMNVLDQLWWLLAFLLLARYLQLGDDRLLYALGGVLGLGLLSKLSILALCLTIPLVLLLFDRRVFGRPAIWLAAGFALLLAAPFIAWQVANDFPFLDFVRAYNSSSPKAMVLERPLLGLLLTMNPVYAPFWGAGAVACLLARDRALRALGLAAWACLVLFVAAGVKFYFAVPLFGLFCVAGALAWERWTAAAARLRPALLLLAASGIAAVPSAAPVLPPAQLQRLADFLRDGEQGQKLAQPASLERYFPHFAEMHGWPELVALTAAVWRSLRPEQRRDAVLMASHYGQAGALNQLGPPQGLPPALGRHMSYHLWSAGADYRRGLFVGFDRAELAGLFETVELRGRLQCQRCMAREQGLAVYYVDRPRMSPEAIRQRLRRYDFF
ncbi:MAG: hypothetical protein D6727_11910 [Gammaproteobacteria bacterium]|nr:MAG: hypothetical protein D6727_11910 [Gammaproteobacteria bacterium]